MTLSARITATLARLDGMGTSAVAAGQGALEPRHAHCTDEELTVTLKDGRKITTPLWWYPRLLEATPQQRASYQLSPFGIHSGRRSTSSSRANPCASDAPRAPSLDPPSILPSWWEAMATGQLLLR